jgi:sugar phosphate isomerase/epimerase
MMFSGISDEAGQPIEVQIKAHKELGWDYMEIRNVDNKNLTLISDEKFGEVYEKVTQAGLKVSCFSSGIANWATQISGDFQKDVDELKNAIPRMHKFGTKYIRVMSWPNDKENPWPDEKWGKEAVRRMKVLVGMAQDAGIIIAHENCSGWAGDDYKKAVRLAEEVDSPAFILLYDTGNVVAETDIEPMEFYNGLKPHIKYVHIKDYKKDSTGKRAVYCGEGDAMVREILADLKETGYNGFVSIEPHLASIVHEGKVGDPEVTYRTYVNYGKKLMELAK